MIMWLVMNGVLLNRYLRLCKRESYLEVQNFIIHSFIVLLICLSPKSFSIEFVECGLPMSKTVFSNSRKLIEKIILTFEAKLELLLFIHYKEYPVFQISR